MARFSYRVKDPCYRHPVTVDSGKPTREEAFADICRYLECENVRRAKDGVPSVPLPGGPQDIRDESAAC